MQDDRRLAGNEEPFKGALTRTDEIEGVRLWSLYWSDGVSDFSFSAMDDPEAVVGFERAPACR